MEQKISSIMNSLSKDFGIRFNSLGDNNFEVSPLISGFDHRAFLKFVVTGDIIRTELRYIFGNLNLEKSIGPQEILDILIENTGSFQMTSAFLSIKVIQGTPYVMLNAYQHFHAKWESKDIVDVIQLQLLDIKTGIIAWSYPDTIRLFRKSVS